MQTARGTDAPIPKPKDIAEYKKIFEEATGIDASGKIDKSDALMAFGLALMQNRAGKGFNIGRMLRSVGKAGEVALPKLQEAKKQARANSLAAGKYALEAKSADEAIARAAKEKSLITEDYYIVPGDGSAASTIASIATNKGKRVTLNATELDKLRKTEGFDKNFTILPGSMYSDVVKEALTSDEAKDWFSDTSTSEIKLFGDDAAGIFTFKVFNIDPNAEGPNRPSTGRIAEADANNIYSSLVRSLDDLNNAEGTFVEAISLLDTEKVGTTLKGVQDGIIEFGRKIGVTGSAQDKMTPTSRVNYILKQLQARNAPEILGEAGKTISDNDRKRVEEIVGEISGFLTGDNPIEAREKLIELKEWIIDKKRNDIYDAMQRLDSYAREDTSAIWGRSKTSGLNEDEKAAKIIELRKRLGMN